MIILKKLEHLYSIIDMIIVFFNLIIFQQQMDNLHIKTLLIGNSQQICYLKIYYNHLNKIFSKLYQ